MDSRMFFIIVLVIIIIGIFFLFYFGYIDHLNEKLNEMVSQEDYSKSLAPLVFKNLTLSPKNYINRYEIPPSSKKRTVLITCKTEFQATLDGKLLTGHLNEQTVFGLLNPSDKVSVLDICANDQTKPTFHLSENGIH